MKRIALACDTGFGLESSLSAHFGRCPFYVLVDVADGGIVGFQVVDNCG